MTTILVEDKLHMILTSLKEGQTFSLGITEKRGNDLYDIYQHLRYDLENYIFEVQTFSNNILTSTDVKEMNEEEIISFFESGKISINDVYQYINR